MKDVLRELGLNASILLSMTLLFFLFTENMRCSCKTKCFYRDVIFGVLLAVVGVLVMASPLDFGYGVVFDARSILLGLAGVFFGWLPALITAAACTAFRIYEGGAGTVPGILVILCSMVLGLGWRKWRREPLAETKWWEFYGLGLIIHLAMIAILAGLLPEIRKAFLLQIAPWILLIYPLVFLALSLLMLQRLLMDLARTDLHASEAQAREFMSAVEQCRVSIVFTDLDGRIDYVNPYFCELTGYSVQEVLGTNPNILSSGRQPKSYYRQLWQTIRAGHIWEGEFCNRRKDGSEYWEYAVIAPILNEAGEVRKYVAAKHDITVQKKYEEDLKVALRAAEAGNEAKSAFLSVMSHELRTPLNQILGPCEFVAEELPEGDAKQMLKLAVEAAVHLTNLVQRILEFSELGGEAGSVLRRIDDPELWFDLALQQYAARASEQGFTIEMSIDRTMPEQFMADEAALSAILSALIDNALRYSDPGTVRVTCLREDDKVCLAVADPGPALSDSQREALFKPFHQLDMSHQRSHGGIGLGLCLCRRYAARCGGTIEVKTDPEGGNRFEFTFPLIEAGAEPGIGVALNRKKI